MPLAVQILLVVALTGLVVFGLSPLLRRLLPEGVQAHLLLMLVRSLLTLLVIVVMALSPLSHKVALILAVGAAYFAAVVLDAVIQLQAQSRGRSR